ncbi:MAG: hypothetical protein LBQ06_00920 [Frankiaceae bacterium]|nr:hypothetical protein [Frankiaceae bacterium]
MTEELTYFGSSLARAAADLLREAGLLVNLDEKWIPSANMPDYEYFLLRSVGGSSPGVVIPLGVSELERQVTLADQVQEFIQEELRALGRSAAWPECPDHPNAHPLRPEIVDGAATWIRYKTHCPIKPLRAFA